MGSGLGSPLGLEDKAPPEPPGCLILEDLQTLHIHPHKQETRGLDTRQAISCSPWWLLLFFQENIWGKEWFVKKNPEISKNPAKSQVSLHLCSFRIPVIYIHVHTAFNHLDRLWPSVRARKELNWCLYSMVIYATGCPIRLEPWMKVQIYFWYCFGLVQ